MLTAFAQPVFDAQATFRELLQAMARPAQPRALPVLPPAPVGVAPAAMAILLSLCDADVKLWLQRPHEALRQHLRFHTGVQCVDDHRLGDFAWITDTQHMPPLESFALGEPRYPDRSASLIVQVPAMHTGRGARYRGPGIASETRLAIDGIADTFWQQRAALAPRAPLGLDIYVAEAAHVAGLPRSTQRLEN